MEPIERSPVQFAVVREDPSVERALFTEHRPQNPLLIASGGCTALALRAWFPAIAPVLIDPNPAQLAHLDRKLHAFATTDEMSRRRAFDIGPGQDGLHECGNFERLFRHLRRFLDTFVIAQEARAARLADPGRAWEDIFTHPYWPLAFAATFSDELLRTMFGPAAVQHAEPGSYAPYFQARIEAGLRAEDRATNPYLHHVLLGHYLDDRAAWPAFLANPPRDLHPFDTRSCSILEVESFAEFDFVYLSNIVDWMSDADCAQLAQRLGAELRPGAVVLWRQLNDPRPLPELFGAWFTFDRDQDERLTALDRSLFYARVHAGVHR